MKTVRAWGEVVDVDNVYAAWRDYARGKRRRPAVARFALTAESQVLQLARELSRGTFRPGDYRLLRITDPKRRLVAAAPIRDRVVHHALHRVVAPRLNRRLVDHTYACLPDRGTHRAILRFQRGLRRYRHALALDIRRYFYSVDRDLLSDLLAGWLPEPPMRALVDTLLDSGAGLYTRPEVAAFLGWDAPLPWGRGLPIGNLTSQWWGNLYLDGLDHFAMRELRVPLYQRYMDDLTLVGDDRTALLDARDAIADWLAVERRLELSDRFAVPRTTRRPHRYLGYVVSRAGIAPGRRLRRRLRAAMRDGDRTAVTSLARAWVWPDSPSRGSPGRDGGRGQAPGPHTSDVHH